MPNTCNFSNLFRLNIKQRLDLIKIFRSLNLFILLLSELFYNFRVFLSCNHFRILILVLGLHICHPYFIFILFNIYFLYYIFTILSLMLRCSTLLHLYSFLTSDKELRIIKFFVYFVSNTQNTLLIR